MDQFFSKNNELVSRKIAAEGIVLLENCNNVLPLASGSRIALFGREQQKFSLGGSGAAAVNSIASTDMAEILSQVPANFELDRTILSFYRQNSDFIPSAEDISAAAGRCDTAIVLITRNAGEGSDRKDVPGDFRLSQNEELLLEQLGKSQFKQVIVTVNAGGLIELGWFKKYSNFNALLLCWQPGGEGLNALAEILCGKCNPSGHLCDTIADKYQSWPSAEDFQEHRTVLEYSEDIYVGYRYFDTVPGAQAKVLYPFGYGLSYTNFQIGFTGFEYNENVVHLQGKITNTGKYPGKEVVQCYVNAPGRDRARLELKDFYKTPLIQPGEKVEFAFDIPVNELKRFDENGEIGDVPGSFVLEKGEYVFFIGSNIRDLVRIGSIEQEQTTIIAVPGNIFQQQNSRKLCADGSYKYSGCQVSCDVVFDDAAASDKPNRNITLRDVADNNNTLDEFIGQLTISELAKLCQGQPPRLPRCTGGIGNLPEYGVSNIQTADGPAGIRCCYPATWFPCAAAAACTWNEDLLFDMGAAIAAEGLLLNLDILLAPGLNIHRDPLCGRNFEYFSEDPLVSGRAAAALVKGIQAGGMGATLKHFACNSRENSRRLCNSIISERALREIYLKGFEIAVKTAKPWCVMSSYNLINGTHASSSYSLLTRLLRNEWGFDGVVMTDWMSIEPMWKEIAAGNDLKMPCTSAHDMDLLINSQVDMDRMPLVSRKELKISARRILQLIMKSHSFKNPDAGYIVEIATGGGRVPAINLSNLSHSGIGVSTLEDAEGEHYILHNIKNNYWRCETALYYKLRFQRAGKYTLSLHLGTVAEKLTVKVLVNGQESGIFAAQPTGTENVLRADFFQTQQAVTLEVAENMVYTVKLIFNDPDSAGCALEHLELKKLHD